MVLKEPTFNSVFPGEGLIVLKEPIFNSFSLGSACHGPERTCF